MPKTATKRPMTLAEYKAKNEKANKDTRSPLAKAVGWDENKTQFIRDLLTGGNDVAGRGMIAGMLGAPGDIAGLAENSLRGLIGKPQVQPWGGSEHIGQTLEQAGLVSDVRRPKTELLASLISPGAAAKTVLNAPKTAMTALRWMDNLDAPNTLGRGLANSQLGIFAGIKAKNAPVDALEQGAKLLDEGADPRKVWADLGVFRGADGKMRWEIDDSKAIHTPISQFHIENQFPIKENLTHENLFGAYDRLNNTRSGGVYDSGGRWDEAQNVVGIKPVFPEESYLNPANRVSDIDAQKSVLFHELQHAVQSREGFSLGGSPKDHTNANNWDELHEMVKGYQPEYKRAYEAAQGKPIDSPEMAELERVVEKYGIKDYIQKRLKPVDPVQRYMRLGGEAEARATQARLGMNAEQRRAVYPFDSYDVPIDQLIHRP